MILIVSCSFQAKYLNIFPVINLRIGLVKLLKAVGGFQLVRGTAAHSALILSSGLSGFTRKVCRIGLQPRRSLCPRRPLLVRHPLLHHLLPLVLTQTDQKQEILPHQGLFICTITRMQMYKLRYLFLMGLIKYVLLFAGSINHQ